MLRPDPLEPARGGVQIVTGARRVEDLKGVLSARQLCIN